MAIKQIVKKIKDHVIANEIDLEISPIKQIAMDVLGTGETQEEKEDSAKEQWKSLKFCQGNIKKRVKQALRRLQEQQELKAFIEKVKKAYPDGEVKRRDNNSYIVWPNGKPQEPIIVEEEPTEKPVEGPVIEELIKEVVPEVTKEVTDGQ